MSLNKARKIPVWGKVCIVILSIIVVLAGSVFGIIQYKLSKINRFDADVSYQDEDFETDPDIDLDEMDPNDVKWPADGEIEIIEGVTNILLVGQDTRTRGKRGRSDTMIILTINKNNDTVSMTSLMRDLYVQIPGYKDNRLNAAYAFGGFKLLDATIEKNFNIPIDANVEVDFSGFKEIIDILDGVDITLTSEEAQYMVKQGYNVSEGVNTLDGAAALAYARNRSIGRSDFTRTERQRTVLTAAFNKMKNSSLGTIWGLLDEVLPLLTTDMSNSQIMSCAYTIFSMGLDDIESYRLPVDGTYTSAKIRGMAVLVPDLKKNRALLKDYIYGE